MTGGKYDRTNGRTALPKFCKNLDSCEERRNSWTLAKNLDSCEERINSSVRGKFFELILAKKTEVLGSLRKKLGFLRKTQKSFDFFEKNHGCLKEILGFVRKN